MAVRAFAVCALLGLVSAGALAQTPADPPADPAAILAAAKAASGGDAWDGFRTQHTTVTILSGGLTGAAERWSEFTTGRSYLRFSLGPMAGTLGHDGTVTWAQDASGQSRVEDAETAMQLAANAAYRDRLAFWYPARHPAVLGYQGRSIADGANFDVVSITPTGGREFELWVNVDTRLIERLVEPEAAATRTEIYMDWRDVEGVKVPFRVRSSRGDAKRDEIVTVDAMEFNVSIAGIDFARPGPPRPDFAFPAGKTVVELPFEIVNGHLYVTVRLNGKGPFVLRLDSGVGNALAPKAAQALGLEPDPAPAAGPAGERGERIGLVRVERMDVAGLRIDDLAFAAIPIAAFMRRVEGRDDVAGRIGHELFKRFPLRIDYARSRLLIYEPTAFRYQGTGMRVPFRVAGYLPRVQGSVDGFDGLFDIDIGAQVGLVLGAPFVAAHELAARYGATHEVIWGVGAAGRAKALLGRAGTLRLGDVATYNPVTYLSTANEGRLANPDVAGTVGYAVLRRFDITFDFARGQLYFEKNANYGDRDVHDRAGLWVERDDKGYMLVEVLPQGPAAQAGLKPGDVVVAVDGRPVAGISLAQLRSRLKGTPGTKVRLKLGSGAERVLTLRDLV